MPMSEQLDSLRQAAMTLLAAAPAGAVLVAVRALLDGLELDRPPGQPALRADQPDNAARIVARGVGIRVRSDARSEEIGSAIVASCDATPAFDWRLATR
jgi:hypothetical protein